MERAETQMAVGHQRVHVERLGEVDRGLQLMLRRARRVTQKKALSRLSSPQRGPRTVLPYNAVGRMTTIVRDWRDVRADESLGWESVLVWIVSLDTAAVGSVLSADETERARRYRFDTDRRRFAVCRAALRAILASYLHVAANEIVLATTANGKPYLDSCHRSDLRFSVSHSHELALIALARRHEVGVDVEHIRAMPGMDDVIQRYFSPGEARALEPLPDHERRRAFFQTWTLKEAYLKGCGDGLTRRLDAIDVKIPADDQPAPFQVRDRPGDEARWILRSIRAGESYAAALAVEHRSPDQGSGSSIGSGCGGRTF